MRKTTVALVAAMSAGVAIWAYSLAESAAQLRAALRGARTVAIEALAAPAMLHPRRVASADEAPRADIVVPAVPEAPPRGALREAPSDPVTTESEAEPLFRAGPSSGAEFARLMEQGLVDVDDVAALEELARALDSAASDAE